MRLYRNVIEYAASKIKTEFASSDAAKLALLDLATNRMPLYSRGLDFSGEDREAPWGSCFDPFMEEREDEWKSWRKKLRRPGMFKKYRRRLRVLEAFEARAEIKARLFNLPSMVDCDKMSRDLSQALLEKRAEDIQEEYPYGDQPAVTVSLITKATPHAKYERMHATFFITKEALISLPCAPVVDDSVILDARPCIDGVWFMRWAVMEKRKKEFTTASGGYFEGELVIGYPSYSDVYSSIKSIQKIARHRAVTRALKG